MVPQNRNTSDGTPPLSCEPGASTPPFVLCTWCIAWRGCMACGCDLNGQLELC